LFSTSFDVKSFSDVPFRDVVDIGPHLEVTSQKPPRRGRE